MKSILLAALFLFLCSPLALADNYDWDEYPDLVKKYKKNNQMADRITVDPEKDDFLIISTRPTDYLVDFRTKRCYIKDPNATKVPIECMFLKESFPELSEVLDRL